MYKNTVIVVFFREQNKMLMPWSIAYWPIIYERETPMYIRLIQ